MKKLITCALLICVSSFSHGADDYYTTPYSSFVNGAEYDSDTGTMTIDLNGRTYEYDDVSKDDWEDFKDSPSAGQGYNRYIKRNYDYSSKW
ncbi:hypothetical protein BOW50_11355 [Solemya velum gill symbiont]|uniref:KTSC domain-containing protein n=1 Tax=Solemya velum gill symbiont TaxID=2340 RepID=UPI000995FD16|nr:KTSC domain-containing protein [Solemya velum gill symbiont]OOZ68819.1 hypothetical protein BOW48_12365 [Solemya velum gill symbiont]OOZ75523.1 hypothetical protein BOW50_11355 [Solemya velum gill symbiont]